MIESICIHAEYALRLSWDQRGVNVVCGMCSKRVYVGRTKLLAYARAVLHAQLGAAEALLAGFTRALDDDLEVTVQVYTDDSKILALRGRVDKVAEDSVVLRVRGEGILFPFSRILNATVHEPELEVLAPDEQIDHVIDEEDTVEHHQVAGC